MTDAREKNILQEEEKRKIKIKENEKSHWNSIDRQENINFIKTGREKKAEKKKTK